MPLLLAKVEEGYELGAVAHYGSKEFECYIEGRDNVKEISWNDGMLLQEFAHQPSLSLLRELNLKRDTKITNIPDYIGIKGYTTDSVYELALELSENPNRCLKNFLHLIKILRQNNTAVERIRIVYSLNNSNLTEISSKVKRVSRDLRITALECSLEELPRAAELFNLGNLDTFIELEMGIRSYDLALVSEVLFNVEVLTLRQLLDIELPRVRVLTLYEEIINLFGNDKLPSLQELICVRATYLNLDYRDICYSTENDKCEVVNSYGPRIYKTVMYIYNKKLSGVILPTTEQPLIVSRMMIVMDTEEEYTMANYDVLIGLKKKAFKKV